MVDPYLRQSPLAHLHLAARAVDDPGDAALWMGERPFRGQLDLRGDRENAEFMSAVSGILGTEPPGAPNTSVLGDGVEVLWLGPDEWLLVTSPGREEALERALLEAFRGGVPGAVVNVGEGRAVITLGGPAAREVLAKGCPLDLHPRVFGPDRCAQSLLAGSPVLLHQTRATPVFDLYVPRSAAEYLWVWLEDAAAEFAPVIVAA